MTDFRRWLPAILILLVGCFDADNGPPSSSGDPVPVTTLALNWYPEAEHGGYYAADELDHFASRDRRVEIIPGSPSAARIILQELATGRIQFAVTAADQVVEQRFRGLPIIALLAPVQQSPRCIMVHESSGFESLAQLAGIELAISETRPFALWMTKKLPLTDVTIVPFNGMVGEFLAKENFAQQAYVFSEPFIAREKGSDPKTLPLSEIGYNPYASVLVTTESMIETDPALVRDIVAACRAGWVDYLASPEKANQRLHAENPEMTIAALEFGSRELRTLCQPEDGGAVGRMTEQRWQTLIDQMEELNVIDAGSVQASDCFTSQFAD